MANPSKARGTAAEVAVRDYLRACGWLQCERLALGGSLDKGDLTGIDPSVVNEVKACKTIDLAGWAKEVEAEKRNAGAEIGATWAKKRGTTNPADWYVVLTGADYVTLLRHYCGRPFTQDAA